MNNLSNISAAWFYLILCFLLNIFFSNNHLLAQDFREQYDEIGEFKDGWAIVKKNKKYGVIDTAYQTVIPFEYQYIGTLGDKLTVQKNYKLGLINRNQEVLIPLKYTNIRPWLNGGYILSKKEANNLQVGIMDSVKNMIVPFERGYQLIEKAENGEIAVLKNGKLGFIDKNGKEIIPPIYDNINEQYGDLRIVRQNGKEGIIDSTGQVVVEPIYERAFYSFDQSLFVVYKNNKVGIIKRDKTVLVPPNKYSDFQVLMSYNNSQHEIFVFSFSNNQPLITIQDGKKGLINHKGEEVLPPILDYDHISLFDENSFAIVNKGGKANRFKEIKGGKWGIINLKGEIVVPMEYDRAFKHQDGTYRLFHKEKGNHILSFDNKKSLVPVD